MSLPEISALCRVLARSSADDPAAQARNLERLNELRGYLGAHAHPGINACLDASSELVRALASGRTLKPRDVLVVVTKLMATVEKSWDGPDPDAELLGALYGAADDAPRDEERDERCSIGSIVHGGKSVAFQASDLEQAQQRIAGLRETPRLNEMVLGELMVELGHVSQEDVELALAEQQRTGDLLGSILVARGAVTEKQVEETLELQTQLRSESTAAALAARVEEPPAPQPAGPRLKLALDDASRFRDERADSTLGAVLVRQGAITQEQLDRALGIQRASGLRLGEALVDMRATDWETIKRAVTLQKRLRGAAGLLPGRPRSVSW